MNMIKLGIVFLALLAISNGLFAMQDVDFQSESVSYENTTQSYNLTWIKNGVIDAASFVAAKTTDAAHFVWQKLPESARQEFKQVYNALFNTQTGRVVVASTALVLIISKIRKH